MATIPEDKDIRRPLVLTIEHKDGTTEVLSNNPVKLKGGANISITGDEDVDEIEIGVVQSNAVETYHDKKLQDLLEAWRTGVQICGPDDPGDGPAYCFSPASLYLATMNSAKPDAATGTIFVNSSACTSVGDFPDNLFSQTIIPQGNLALLDVCTPCLDCLQFGQLQAYLERIEDFYTYIEKLANPPGDDTSLTSVQHPDGGYRESFVGTYQQHRAQSEFYDYLTHESCLSLNAVGQGQSITVATCYRNISDQTKSNVQFFFELQFYEDGVDWEVDTSPFELLSIDRPGAIQIQVDESSLSFGNTGLITFNSIPVDVPPGVEVNWDYAYLIKQTDKYFQEGSSYSLDVNLEVENTHIAPPGINKKKSKTIVFVPGRQIIITPGPSEGSGTKGLI